MTQVLKPEWPILHARTQRSLVYIIYLTAELKQWDDSFLSQQKDYFLWSINFFKLIFEQKRQPFSSSSFSDVRFAAFLRVVSL